MQRVQRMDVDIRVALPAPGVVNAAILATYWAKATPNGSRTPWPRCTPAGEICRKPSVGEATFY